MQSAGREVTAETRQGWSAIRVRALGITLLVALAVGAAAFLLGRGRWSPGADARLPLPPPSGESASQPHDSIRFADFVGSEACASCHRAEYDAWRQSTHGRAGGPPSAERSIADFDGKPIRFADAVVIPSVREGRYQFEVRQEGEPARVFRVDGVIGGGHMVGGGTQGFVSRFPDGTVRFLPFDFIRREGVWFCNTGTRGRSGYHRITPDMRLAECGDWPPVRILGDEPRFASCQQCHGSQIITTIDSASHGYDTRYTTLAINCESCHGPGREHVEIARSGRIASAADIGMRSLATLSKDESTQLCFQCHSLKNQLLGGYLPGKSLQEYYSTKLAILGDEPLHPDGRVRTFAYQQNQLYSACYRNGSMTCTSCHDPHSQRYRDVNGYPLEGRYDDRQCTSCHVSLAANAERHTHHPADSPGSRCVSCHMPYLQHPEVGTELRFARSDHTIPIPRPAFDSTLGVENACSSCHADRSVASLQAQVEQWYGSIKPHPPLVAGLVAAKKIEDRDSIAKLVLGYQKDDAIAQFAGLSYYVEEVLRPDMSSLPDAVEEVLERLAVSDDIDVRALALAALHFARGEEPDVRRFLVARLDSLGSDGMAVRRRWVVALGYLGDRARANGDAADAISSYRKALEILPDDPRVLANAGLAYREAGDPRTAERYLRQSIAADPLQPVTLVNLGNVLFDSGDVDGAVTMYRRALALNPREPLAYFGLGKAAFARRNAASAAEMFEKTVELDASLVPAYLNLARAYYMRSDHAAARRSLERALEFAPTNAEAREMLRTLK
ncbi:MAG TPA: tetratricopeptide repeat protein [Gemmatimonadaceae bacterium]|nr:tetratricopeptide repeat protein [Gemmatimonadaceae bacterium]